MVTETRDRRLVHDDEGSVRELCGTKNAGCGRPEPEKTDDSEDEAPYKYIEAIHIWETHYLKAGKNVHKSPASQSTPTDCVNATVHSSTKQSCYHSLLY